MIVVNTEVLLGREVAQVLGMVQGNTVRAKNVGRDIAAGFNIRFVSADVGGSTTSRKGSAMVATIASGTAYIRRSDAG